MSLRLFVASMIFCPIRRGNGIVLSQMCPRVTSQQGDFDGETLVLAAQQLFMGFDEPVKRIF